MALVEGEVPLVVLHASVKDAAHTPLLLALARTLPNLRFLSFAVDANHQSLESLLPVSASAAAAKTRNKPALPEMIELLQDPQVHTVSCFFLFVIKSNSKGGAVADLLRSVKNSVFLCLSFLTALFSCRENGQSGVI